jgi:hypothetical protein
VTTLLAALLVGGLAWLARADEDPPKPADIKPAAAGTLVLVDSAGKEHKIKTWKFTAGVRRMGWLTPAVKPAEKDEEKDKAKGGKARRAKPRPVPAGPLAFVLRESGEKIVFVEGVLTYIPLDRLRSLEFDSAEKTVKARVATTDKPEDDLVLSGTTRYGGINKLSIEAEVDKGEDGIATITYQAGGLKSNLRAVRFPAPKVPAAIKGRPATVESAEKDMKTSHKVYDLQGLYQLPRGSQRLFGTLLFKRTLKVDLKKVKKITASGEEDSDDIVWQVTRGDEELSLTLLRNLPKDIKPAALAGASLLGMVGKAAAGYKLFPLRTVASIEFDAEETKEKEKDKEKEEKKEKEDK